MNAVRWIGIEEMKTTGSPIFGKNRDARIINIPFTEFDSRDWILTPELGDAVAQFELNFNISGNPERNQIKLTHNLKTFLKQLQKNYPPSTIRKTGASIFQCFNVFFTNLSSYPKGRVRAIAAYELLDRELAISADLEATCRRGCTACCHLEKEITFDEADLLAALIKKRARSDIQPVVEQIANKGKNAKKRHRSKLKPRCPFLGKDHMCMVYAYRPMVCRKYKVTSPPDECYKKDGSVKQIPLIAEEVVVSAALSCHGNYCGTMPVMLSKALEAQNCRKQAQDKIDVIRVGADSKETLSKFHESRYPMTL
jgi:Fe-S-cluster containining protein